MLQQIADLVEFDLNRFSSDQIIEDFNHKFTKSFLKIDGQYYKVHNLSESAKGYALLTTNKEGNEITIKELKSIEKVLPKTGLYSSIHGLLYLNRIPKRQWIKSFAPFSNYEYHRLESGQNGEAPTPYDTILVDNPVYAKESMIYNNNVYLHWKKVGKVKDNTIYVTNKNFLEEIKELWNPQYQIILDVNNPKPRVEKLMLDF